MSIIDEIQAIKAAGKFENYINFIQFPIFKNLEENTRINFDFPMTVLVGKNGSNKSSVLTALYGAPKGKSTGEFWFSTSTDPIDETVRGDRNRYFYQYIENINSVEKEVLKQRAPREGNPDYWEPSDPVKKIGMTDRVRNEPVSKNVVYIDFRGQLSAFDKYFYFGIPKEGKKQDFLRKKSPYLKRAFDKIFPLVVGYNGKKIGTYALEHRTELNTKEINAINRILGKSYESIILVEHQFYDRLGYSAFIKSSGNNGLRYSEANAGSGETAVIQLVHQVMSAEEFSLILLDEPEVSLHPSAQNKIRLFLLDEIKKHKHQVVISTHSPAIIKELPPCAIKLFTTNNDGYFHIAENVDYRTAFFELEEYIENKLTIICEDIDAQNLINRALGALNIKEHFVVWYPHGGADTIMNYYIPAYATNENLRKNIFVIFDGDKYCESVDIEEFTQNNVKDVTFLEEQVKKVYSGNLIEAKPDGGRNGGREDQKCEDYLKYIKYHHDNVGYLPNGKIPEEIILNSQYIETKYKDIISSVSEITSQNAKSILWKIKEKRNDADINLTFEALSYELFDEESSDDLNKLKELLENIFHNNQVQLAKKSLTV